MTEQEQLEFINTTCNTDYKSVDEVDWYNALTIDDINRACEALHEHYQQQEINKIKE